jgi:hypothetical protein
MKSLILAAIASSLTISGAFGATPLLGIVDGGTGNVNGYSRNAPPAPVPNGVMQYDSNGNPVSVTAATARANLATKALYGGICDGTSHPLSANYPNLAAAQAKYPAAQSISDETDWAAMTALVTNFRVNLGVAYTGSSYMDAKDWGQCVLNKTLDITNIRTHSAYLDFSGTSVFSSVSGPKSIAVDNTMANFSVVNNLTIRNFGSAVADIGFMSGRNSTLNRANQVSYYNLHVVGSFSVASAYNFAGEVNQYYSPVLTNAASGGIAFAADGLHHLTFTDGTPVASQIMGNTAPTDTIASFYQLQVSGGTIETTGVGGTPVWFATLSAPTFDNVYVAATGGPLATATNYVSYSITGMNQSTHIQGDESVGVTINSHAEAGTIGAAAVVLFSGPNTTQTLMNFTYRDPGYGAITNIFKADTGVSSITMPGMKLDLGNVHGGKFVFDQPSVYHLQGAFNLGNAYTNLFWNLDNQHWIGSLQWSGGIIFNGQGNLKPYGMNVTLAAGGVNITGVGSIAGYSVSAPSGYGGNTSGVYTFPTVTISPPDVAGGTQALAHVNDWGFYFAPQVGGGANWVLGGSGYSANDILTGVGGTSATPYQVKVLTVDGSGSILTWAKQTTGSYTVSPSMPASFTGGTGTGATISRVAWTPNNITNDAAGSGYLAPTITVNDVPVSNAAPPTIAITVTPGTVSINGFTALGDTAYDVFAGQGAGASNSPAGGATENTGFGYNALNSVTTNTYNTGFGYKAGELYTGTSVGGVAANHALSAFGGNAGGTVTTGPDNTALGASAMFSTDGTGLTTGSDNLAVGVHTLTHLTSGGFNVAIGNESMVGCNNWTGFPSCLLTGSENTGIGDHTLANIQGGAFENTAVGANAGLLVTTATENIFLGTFTGAHVANGDTAITGTLNTLIGRDLRLPTGATSNYLNIGNLITGTGLTQGGGAVNGTIAINGTLNVASSATIQGVVIASNAGSTYLGPNAGQTISGGQFNTAVGKNALYSTDGVVGTGSSNLAFGFDTLTHLTSGTQNVAMGSASMIGCGVESGAPSCTLTGSLNVGVGYQTLKNIQGAAAGNLAIGGNAMLGLTTGTNNTSVGYNAGSNITTGASNTIIGYNMQAQSPTSTWYLTVANVYEADAFKGHAFFGMGAGGVVPTLSGCGTGAALDAYATDVSGRITTGPGATGCTLTFGSAYAHVVHATVTEESIVSGGISYIPSATNIVISGAVASTYIDYKVDGQ